MFPCSLIFPCSLMFPCFLMFPCLTRFFEDRPSHTPPPTQGQALTHPTPPPHTRTLGGREADCRGGSCSADGCAATTAAATGTGEVEPLLDSGEPGGSGADWGQTACPAACPAALEDDGSLLVNIAWAPPEESCGPPCMLDLELLGVEDASTWWLVRACSCESAGTTTSW